MSNITGLLSRSLFSIPVYWGIAQLPSIQIISLGLTVISYGKQLVWDYDPTISRKWKVLRWMAGGALIVGAVASLIYGSTNLINLSRGAGLRRAIFFGENPGISAEKDPYESAYEGYYEKTTPIEGLMSQNPVCKERILYLAASAEVDHNGATDPFQSFGDENFDKTVPHCIRKFSDVVYKTIRHPLQICERIQSAAKEGPIQDLFIHAHGNPYTMGLSKSSRFKVFDLLPQDCFDGLASNARIFINSCRTGANGLSQPNIAQWISWISNREVIASDDATADVRCFIDQFDNRLNVKEFYFSNGFHSFHLAQSLGAQGIFFAQTVLTGLIGVRVFQQIWSVFQRGRALL